MKYIDYLIVGSGLFGSIFAHEATKRGKRCLVIDKRSHIGGNIYCENKDHINIHKYGAHIFHTNNQIVWNYINQFSKFNNFINTPIANYNGEIYNLPFNMNTFSKMWNISTPKEAFDIINKQRAIIKQPPRNLEEQAISLVGIDIYKKLIQGYTEKQWGRPCNQLPAFIIKRLPVRYTYNNNYFNAIYQGIPINGYNTIIENLLKNIEVKLNIDFNLCRDIYTNISKKIIYTGSIDSYFNYQLGTLDYRGLKFKTYKIEQENFQGVAVMNFTDKNTPYTRIIEHKHFEFGNQPITYITKEYPSDWKIGDEAYYPINDEKNQNLYKQYIHLAKSENNIIFGGRLGEYKYYDMDQVIQSALNLVDIELN
ncbi:UDP-galactopyranose mutase [Megamonas funiformis]|uniref:UDP-galactopyranose mutase n=1 Tax=Megamonas funiformis TaxID=437897 RepID=UPI00388FE880